jgi:hypothetical protein
MCRRAHLQVQVCCHCFMVAYTIMLGEHEIEETSSMTCRKQKRAPICQEPGKLYDACCSADAVARRSHLAASLYQSNPAASRRSGMHFQSESTDGGTADYYLSVQYFTKHVSRRTVVQPRTALTDVTVARALVLFSSVLMTGFVSLAAMFVLLWSRKARCNSNKQHKGMGKRSMSGDTIPALH